MAKRSKEAVLDLNYRRKNRRKTIRSGIQLAILLAVLLLIGNAVFHVQQYQEPHKSSWTSNGGFIALSYFGVDRTGTAALIAKKQLEKQLKALYDQGYVTISQQDIIDYYTQGALLPEKALFLAFEDGRNDSSLYAQPLLERYNDKATFLSYANNLVDSDRKFVKPDEMMKMMKSGYWELGSNGYRLTYINIHEKDGAFIGMLDENKLPDKSKLSDYNHYLMDFLRDADGIPVEDREEMETRIAADYSAMREVYSDKLGYMPKVYMIMHANALHKSMNRLVDHANASAIKKLFAIHFNREGNACNSADGNLYDLTRIQPQPYWQTNHMLMKVQKDCSQIMSFIVGDEERANDWTSLSGVAEFVDNRIALTSPAGGAGIYALENSSGYRDVSLQTELAGDEMGTQGVYLRYNPAQASFLRASIADNKLVIEQKKPEGEAESLFSAPLKEDQVEHHLTIRTLKVRVQGERLSAWVDNQEWAKDIKVDGSIADGEIAIFSAASTLNEKDDIYDGVFDNFEVTSLSSGDLLYSNTLTGIEGALHRLQEAYNRILDWAIDTF
ncbi:polysaccharide deacetylase family protein [Paenibacillus sp. HB172176]|uniref:polysaccharide deacetylase family protein n=1 Tax=Paenibacillus sp. HB172176 TaxID=2493690 RepID=UPI001438DF8A|nr:polysaccharide deacetylase family protein [Paenibacillus sp. HB172176]